MGAAGVAAIALAAGLGPLGAMMLMRPSLPSVPVPEIITPPPAPAVEGTAYEVLFFDAAGNQISVPQNSGGG